MQTSQLPDELGGRRRQSGDEAHLLFWAGFGMFGIYLTTVLASAWPLALLQPAWQEQLARSLINGAIFPLVGACLVVIASVLQPASDTLARRLRRVRRLAFWAAIGFVLLIPLLAFTGVRQLRSSAAEGRQRLEQVRRVTEQLQKASTATELREALLQLPGIQPPQLPASFDQPIPALRARLLERLQPRLNAVETRMQRELSMLWQRWLQRVFRDALTAGFLAVSFAAIGRPGPGSPSLLWTLTHRGRRRRVQPRGAPRGGFPRDWLPEQDDSPTDAGRKP